MFVCIYGRGVSRAQNSAAGTGENSILVDLAFTFSPLVEQTTIDTVVLDVSGQDLLFGGASEFSESAEVESAVNLANEIFSRSKHLLLKTNVAVAPNPDAAIHAARSFRAISLIAPGDELLQLGSLSIKKLDCSLAAIDEKRATELQETFALWGIRTFGDLARLPLAGVAERLGQDGVQLQKLAQGKTNRNLNLVRPPVGFEQSLELEHPISELEPLSFILSRLLNQLCANLNDYALATNEVRLRLGSEPGAVATGSNAISERIITLPVPLRNPKTLLRLLVFEIEREPPQAPIVRVAIDFRRELSLEDGSVTVACSGTGYGRSSIRTAETIRAKAGWLAAESESVIVAHDAGSRTSRPITDRERSALDAAIEADRGSVRASGGSRDRT